MIKYKYIIRKYNEIKNCTKVYNSKNTFLGGIVWNTTKLLLNGGQIKFGM